MTAFEGSWVRLERVAADDPTLAELDKRRESVPQMGSAVRREAGRPFVPAMLIQDRQRGIAIGVVDSWHLPGYAGVASVNVFVDERQARPGPALQAFVMYVFLVFAAGAEVVHLETLENNRSANRILTHSGFVARARYREHAWAGGRFWDVIVYSFNLAEWQSVTAKGAIARLVPGAERPPAALAGARPASNQGADR